MEQITLLDTINQIIKRALDMVLERNLIADTELVARIKQNRQIPYRRFQALMLTSSAFMNMSAADAADVMNVSTMAIEHYLWELRQEFPHIEQFEQAWKSPSTMQNIETVDETTIVHIF